MGGVPAGQAEVRRWLQAGIVLLLFWSAAAAEIPPELLLEHQVLIPFRLWDAANQEYMTDLSRISLQEFRIRENGQDQVPLSVDLERRPLSLALAVDISGSMEESLPSVRQAARRLGNRLKPLDRVAVLSFNREVVLRSGPSADRRLLQRNLAELHSWGFTAVYDAIHEGLETLKHEPDPRAIVVLTDGGDNRSTRSMKQVADQARKARIPLFFICHKVDPSGFGELLKAADETGGRVFRSARDQDLLRIFGTIAEGLRNTFILAYRPSLSLDEDTWRRLDVKYGTRRLKFDSFKTGYYPGALPPETPPGTIRSEGGLEEPYPRELCPLREKCEEPLRISAAPGSPSRLMIDGWIDVGHDMGAMVHPTRYGETEPIPNDPRWIDLKYWPFQRGHARPESISILLPEPDALPRSAGGFWQTILATGAVFHVTGMEQVQPSEYRPAENRMTIPPVPGMAGTPDPDGPQQLWWIDGRIASDFREAISRWVFMLMPSYRDWTEQRHREQTETVVEKQVEATLDRVETGLPEAVRAGIASMVEKETRKARRSQWSSMLSGASGPTTHLLPRHADIPAADWLAAADAVLVDRLLAGPVPDRKSLKTDWLDPAGVAWSRLRTFFSPIGHQSLTPGIPFLDETTGSIYLQRVVLPWVEQRAGDRHFGRFPAPVPAGLHTVAEILRDGVAGSRLSGGRYRCDESGVTVTPGFSREVEQRPAEWLLKLEALQSEKRRLREVRHRLGPRDGDWILEEEQALDRQLHALRRPSGIRVVVVLEHAGRPGVGLRLIRQGAGLATAAPLQEPGFALEAADPELLADLPGLAERNGLDRTGPAVTNAFLAADINGLDGPTLAGLLSDGPVFDSIRLRWSGPGRGSTRPARLIREDSGTVLEIDLAGTTADLLKDALASLSRPKGN